MRYCAESSAAIFQGRTDIHRRSGQHPFGGGADRVLPEWIQWWGVVADIFRDTYSVGGGVVSEIFRDPDSVGWQKFSGIHILWGGRNFSVNYNNRPSIRAFFPLTAVTDPKFVLFKYVLCFARIISTLCPNSCPPQTARIGGGGSCPPSRTPMLTYPVCSFRIIRFLIVLTSFVTII